MNRYVLEGIALLLRTELMMQMSTLHALHILVRNARTADARNPIHVTCEDLCRAVDIACVLYFKRVLCLQRSVVTVILLRHHGFNADLVVGAQSSPFKAHAWAELSNVVINDKPYVPSIYAELERC